MCREQTKIPPKIPEVLHTRSKRLVLSIAKSEVYHFAESRTANTTRTTKVVIVTELHQQVLPYFQQITGIKNLTDPYYFLHIQTSKNLGIFSLVAL